MGRFLFELLTPALFICLVGYYLMKIKHEPDVKLSNEELDALIRWAEKNRLKPIKIGDKYYYLWNDGKVPVLCESK